MGTKVKLLNEEYYPFFIIILKVLKLGSNIHQN